MKNVLHSNVRAKQASDLSFDEFFDFRKKQMCSTLMFLCDLLGETKINLEIITQLKEVGQVLEMMSTAFRDLNKYKKNEITMPNSYLYWAKYFDEDEKKSQDAYFNYIQTRIESRFEGMNKYQKKIIKVARKFLESYYFPVPKL